MNTNTSNKSLLKQPSAFIPLFLSFAALSLVIGHFLVFGITHQADEGVAARVFQILMVIQVPIVAYFALKWLPKQPRQALFVLVLQASAWLAAIMPVLWLT